MSASLSDQISARGQNVNSLQAMIQGIRYQGLFYAMIGSNNVFGCKVTNELFAATAITSSSVANPTVITATNHGLPVGTSQVEILGHSGSTPSINGLQTATYIDASHFSIPVNVTVGGTGGTVRQVSMILSLDGNATGDSLHLNPDGQPSPIRPEQYYNIANIYGEVFLSNNINVGTLQDPTSLTIAAAPSAGYHRYDAVYAYVTSAGARVGVATGAAVANASVPTLPSIPQGTLLLAQVNVSNSVLGILSTDITDLRNFNGRLTGSTPVIAGTSATSLAIGLGAATLTTQAGIAFTVGQWVVIANSAAPTNSMTGQITAYSGTSLTVSVTATSGTGTYAAWNIALAGVQGVSWVQGPVGVITAATTLTAAQSGTSFDVQAATAGYNIVLPTLFSGMRYRFVGANGAFPVGLAYTGTLMLPDGTTAAAGTFSQINLAAIGNSLEVWSDGTNVYVQDIGGQTIIKNAAAANQAVALGQADARYANSGANADGLNTVTLTGSTQLTSAAHAGKMVEIWSRR